MSKLAKKSLEQRIAQLEAQKKTLKARLSKQERAKETRRKILIGALVLDRIEADAGDFSHDLKQWVASELPGFLTRQADHELFDDLLQNTSRTDAGDSAS